MWTNNGVLYYERKLKQEPVYWTISGKVLLFKEEEDSDKLFAVKLLINESALLFEIKLPLDEMLAEQREAAADEDDFMLTKKDFLFGYEPNNHLLVTLGNKIYFTCFYNQEAKVKMPNIHDKHDKSFMDQDKNVTGSNCSDYLHYRSFRLKDFNNIKINSSYRPLEFQELGEKELIKKEESVLMLILEHRQSHILNFMKLYIRREKDKDIVEFKHMGDGMKDEDEDAKRTDRPVIKKWFSFITCNEENEPYHLAVVLRHGGDIDFYYDFSLIEENKNL